MGSNPILAAGDQIRWRRLPGGGLAERSKAHAWKACRGATPSRVRTPQPPPPRGPSPRAGSPDLRSLLVSAGEAGRDVGRAGAGAGCGPVAGRIDRLDGDGVGAGVGEVLDATHARVATRL